MLGRKLSQMGQGDRLRIVADQDADGAAFILH